jgi:hypothetical protein
MNRYFARSQGFTNSVQKILRKKMPWDYTSAINELINEIDDELYIHEHLF